MTTLNRTAEPVRTGDRRHLRTLDGVRAVAAFAVIATHAGYASGDSLRSGPLAAVVSRLTFGVTLFFLLSGFLLYGPFVRAIAANLPRPATGRFYWRRTLRILPAYWLALALTLSLLSTRVTSRGDWLSYLSLTQTYTGRYLDPALNQTWTLVVEVSFYAALPLLAAAARLLARRLSWVSAQLYLMAALAVVALGWDMTVRARWGSGTVAQLWLPAYLDWFALGMLLAVAATAPAGHRWRDTLYQWSRVPGTCWLAGVLLFWLATTSLAGPRDLTPDTGWEWIFQHYLYGGAAFFFLLPLMLGADGWHARVLGSGPLAWLGRVSYGIYLWHLGLLLALQRWLGWPTFGGHGVVLFLATSIIATAVATGSWLLVEQPLLRRLGAVRWRSASDTGR